MAIVDPDERCETISSPDALSVLVQGSDSYAPYLQDSGELHDPVFGVPTQYGTAYHAHVNAVLSVHGPQDRRAEFADRALRGLDAALRHTENPHLPATASSFVRDTGSVNRAGNHRDFTWPPILKTLLILRDPAADDPALKEIADRIRAVDIEASFRSRPPSNWASVWLSGEWIRVREGLSPNSRADIDALLEPFFERIDVELGWYEEPGRPNSYDLFTRYHLADLLAEGYDGAHAEQLKVLLQAGLQRSLAVQMSDGSLPTAHRSAGQSWTDGVQVSFLTHAAVLTGNAAAEIAAQRAFSSLIRWQRAGGPFSPVQNVLPPARRVGYEGYTADAHYANLALSFLAGAVHSGFRATSTDLDSRAASYRIEGAPISRAVAHSGRISVQVNADPAPAYDGFGITDVTFGTHRRLHFSSSVKSLYGGRFLNPGLALRVGAGRSRLLPVSSCGHTCERAIERVADRLGITGRVEDSGDEDIPAFEHRLEVGIEGAGIAVTESTPSLQSYKSVLVPYLRDIGAGIRTTVEPTADGAVLSYGAERIRVVVEGAIDPVLDLPEGYENRRGLCGLLRIDLTEPAETVRYRIISE